MLKPNTVKSFQEYAEEVFVKFVQRHLQSLKRTDIVWDRYLANSIKGSAREKRDVEVRRKVSAQSKIPSNWLNFLHDPNNKTELFAFLTKGSAREKRGVGVRRKVSAQSKVPSNWLNFLHDPNNKTELFAFLTKVASEKLSLEGK